MELNIDKSQWVKVQFGDVVQKVSNKIDPETYHSEIVIQGGHINKRDFHIRKYENKNELGYLGPAFHMGFKQHQILYVSRNPHLMKVGYPHFDGICANTTFIMETKDESVLRNDLIPFIMHSDTFIEESVANVRGGVNPYVNWSDLACIEFLLPPKDQQAQLAKLLWAMDEVIEREISLLDKLEATKQSLYKEIFNGSYFGETSVNHNKLGKIVANWNIVKLDSLVEAPICYGIVQPGDNYDKGVPVVQIKNMLEFDLERMHYVAPEIEKPYSRSRINQNDLILAIKGTIGICNIVPEGFEGNIGRDTAKINLPNTLVREYIKYLFRSPKYQLLFDRLKVGSTRFEISIGTLRELPILMPPDSTMKKIIEAFKVNEIARSRNNAAIENSKSLQKGLINQVF